MIQRAKKRLGEILVESEILAPEHLDEALQHQRKEGGLIGQILIRLGYISEDDLVAALSRQLHIPYLPLANYSVNMEAVHILDEEFCRRNMAIIFDQDEKRTFMAMADPLNDTTIEEVGKRIRLKLQVFISTPTEIFNMLELAFSSNAKKAMKKAG